MSRSPWLLLVLFAAACSGDDSHRQGTMHARVEPQPAVAGSGSAIAPTTITADATGTTGATTPAADAQPAQLSEDMATPAFTDGDAKVGAERFALHDWAAARDAFTRARTAAAPGDLAARLDLMIGLADAELSAWPEAATHLEAARVGIPELADYLGYHEARAQFFAHHADVALTLARGVAPGSIVGADAQLLVGDILRGNGAWPDVVAQYRDYLAHHSKGPRLAEARYWLAQGLGKTAGDRAERIALLRSIEVDDPLASWATKAHDELAALATTPAERATFAAFSGTEHIARGKALFEAMRNPEGEAEFADALADAKLTPDDKCVAAYHRAQSRFKARDRKGAAPMFDDAITACHAAGNVDLDIKSNYQAGRSYSYFGEHQTAIDRYKAAETIDPKHSYADDAMLREAEEWASLNDGKQVEAVLSALPKQFPDGDNTAEAMWRLGWRAWRDKKYDAAITWWKQQVALVPHDDNYWGEGEAQYWLGRAYAAKHETKQAIAAWTDAVRNYPAAYYALLALNRLAEAAPATSKKLIAELAAPPAGFDPNAPAFTFKPRVEWGTPGFLRAMELLRLGLGEPAEAELRALGLTPPADKKRVDDPDTIEKLWAIAFLYDRAGRYATSHWPTRWHILDYRRAWPTGANRARWQIAYPKAYWELLNRHADLNKVPIAMQIAIVREESAFDPLDESYANAIGLTQMIPPTAKDFARGTGIDPTRENLRDPEKNVTIGSRFLGSLFTHWNNFTLLVPPSYNAGPAGVGRMLKARGTWDADEFVEGIVDDQARNYTKRVLGSFFTYTWLYQGTVPTIPNRIPTDLLPKTK